MMFCCNWCNGTFDEPRMNTVMENLDGENGWMTWHIPACPFCGDEDIEDMKGEDDDA